MTDGAPGPAPVTRLLLVRHGEVSSHRGDVPVTEAGLAAAGEAGRAVGSGVGGGLLVLTAGTLRSRQTAEAMAAGARTSGAEVDGPRAAFALRNPDVYLAGERVDMVSSPAAYVEQAPGGITEAEVSALPFFGEFMRHADRIGWWLRHPAPPGDDAATVATRVERFAVSLCDVGDRVPEVTIAVTHSPVLRASAYAASGVDPGEPDWLTGLELTVSAGRAVQVVAYPRGTAPLP